MNFSKTIKKRVWVFSFYILIGIVLLSLGLCLKKSDFSSLGAALTVIGTLKIIKNICLLKNKAKIEQQKIIENDERNIFIAQKSRSLSFTLSSVLLGVFAIICIILGKAIYAIFASYTIISMLIINLLSYYIISKNS